MDIIDNVIENEIIIGKKDKKCAPGITFTDCSCYELVDLIEMVKAYNEEYKDNMIVIPKNFDTFVTLNPSKCKKYLLHQLSKKLSPVCDNQHCWSNQPFINKIKSLNKQRIKNNIFRPEGPQGKFEWLNTVNIDMTMEQYEAKYKDFKFLGAVPMNFDDLKLDPNIKDINFSNYLSKNKSKFGIVFNLDESWKSGSHWVACYADIKKGEIYYYDSYGIAPEERVRKFMRRVANFCTQSGIKNVISTHNKIRHQYGGSECGVFSIHFILMMLKGRTFEDVTKNGLDDEKVNKCRKVYFK